MGVSNVPAASASGLQPKYQKFTSSGTFTLPTGYGAAKPLLINIQVIGGGGGGSGPNNTTSNNGTLTYNVNIQKANYFGLSGNYTNTFNPFPGTYIGQPGGSGGIAQTQMYLTSNLSITVGAAGTRGGNTFSPTAWNSYNSGADNNSNNVSGATSWANNTFANWRNSAATANTVSFPAGNAGGTSTAGSVSATGGNGASAFNATANFYDTNNHPNSSAGGWQVVDDFTARATNNSSVGNGGTPAGTAGSAVPLLGTLAGGAQYSTSVKGSFGVGGIQTDGATSTGVDGTGGGANSSAASGAVIITWWE